MTSPANRGAKGRPFLPLRAGGALTLAEATGGGCVHRIWLTLSDLDEEVLCGLRIQAWWDDAEEAAIDAPLGAFFGHPLGQLAQCESLLFSSPEGRSLCFSVPMHFTRSARISLVNPTAREIPRVFYEVNMTSDWSPDIEKLGYLHASWRRERVTALGHPFEILPEVRGTGRIIGVQLAVRTDPRYGDLWWGEGEVRMRLDASDGITLSSTGLEDYVGAGWGLGTYSHATQGCTVAEGGSAERPGAWSAYRCHASDPVVFARSASIWIHPIGGGLGAEVAAAATVAPVLPVTIDLDGELLQLLDQDRGVDPFDGAWSDKWVNFYRSDDYSATVWYLLDAPDRTRG